MSKYQKGNWPPQNTKAIVNSIRRVFEKRDIEYLTEAAYKHIIANMGFIAHYNRQGFKSVYVDLAAFAEVLLTSEYSRDLKHNSKDADRYTRDSFFTVNYGQAYCQSVVACNQGIIELANKYLVVLRVEKEQAIEAAERAELARLQAKYPQSEG